MNIGSVNNNGYSSNGTSSLKDFEVIKTLGEGSFARVYKVVRKSDGQSYAMKKCKIGLMKQRDKDNALNEVRILASIKNPFVIAYKEAIYEESSECLYMIMEYAAGGDLYQQVKNCIKQRSYIDENQIWIWTIQMLYGLKALHDLKVLHRDLKCANIFLDSRRNVKIGDLNVSKITQANLARTQVGTPYYTAPEIWKDSMYNNKSDVWSLGCLIYELCTQKPPFTAPDMPSLSKKVNKGIYERLPSKYSNDLSFVISQCLNTNQYQRLDCDQLLNLPIIKKKIEDLNIKFENYVKEDTKQQLNTKQNVIDQIQYPVNKRNLQERLPKPSYHTNSQKDIKKIVPQNQQNSKEQAPAQDQQKNMRRYRSNSGTQLLSNNQQQTQPPQRMDLLLEQEIQRRLNKLNSHDKNPSQNQLLRNYNSSQNQPPNQNDSRRRKISEDLQNYQNNNNQNRNYEAYSNRNYEFLQNKNYENYSNRNYENYSIPANYPGKQYERKRQDRHSFYERNNNQENDLKYNNRQQMQRDLLSIKYPFNSDYQKNQQINKKPYPLRGEIPLPYNLFSNNPKEYFGQKRIQTEARSIISKQFR